VLRYAGPLHRTWATALSWLNRPVEPAGDRAYTLVADRADLTALRTRLDRAVGGAAVRAACGSPGADGGFAQSFDEAELLLSAIADDDAGQLSFDGAGILQLLLAVPAPRLRYFVRRHLGSLVDQPALLETLRCWLDSGGSRQSVSAQLHLHRNTVGYRVGRVKSVLGVDPLDPRQRAVLHAALEAHRLLEGQPRAPEPVLTAADAHS
jgi:sugar diacid utilization regulator